MEKYCKSCGRVFKNSDFKICPYCGSQLSIRTGRQPIPRKLRHEVFKRDGYRCRECGASKDETSLEIDHILPVAKGGTNDIDNLQTLCRECNRMKHTDEWVGGESDLETIMNELHSIKNQIKKVKNNLSQANNENDKIEYKYHLMKLEERLIIVEKQYGKLQVENKQFEVKREKEEKRNQLYKKLYIQLSDNEISVLSEGYGINYDNKDKIIRFLVNKYTEKEIYDVLTNYKNLQKEKARREATQKKMNRWKRGGWGASQEAMDRWEKARKDKGATQKKIDRMKQPKNKQRFVEKARLAQARWEQTKQAQTKWVQNKTKQDKREKARRKKFRKEKAKKEESRIKSESAVVTGEVKCLGEGSYRYTYKTSDGKKGSIYGSSIEDLKIKSRQYKIQWNP